MLLRCNLHRARSLALRTVSQRPIHHFRHQCGSYCMATNQHCTSYSVRPIDMATCTAHDKRRAVKRRADAQPRWQPDGSSVLDLFGEVIVTCDDVEHWLDTVPAVTLQGFRRANYSRYWDVPGKVRAMILAGLFVRRSLP